MKTSNSLFLLIKSMSKSEKGYFKKYASFHTIGGKNNYVKLFDAIDEQTFISENYDEEKIKKKFGDKFLSQFPVIKNYLYSAVLESLQNYHKGDKPDLTIRDLLEQHDVLMSKSLNKQAADILKKAKKIAYEKEIFIEHLKILVKEKAVLRVTVPTNEFVTELNRINEEQNNITKKMNNINGYVNLRYKIEQYILTYGTGFARDESQKNLLIKLLNDPLLKDESKALSRTALRFYISYKGNLLSYLDKRDKAYPYHARNVEILEEDIKKATSNEPLLVALNNLVSEEIRMGKFETAEEILKKVTNFEEIYGVKFKTNEMAFAIYSQIVMGLSICLETLGMEKGREISKTAGALISGYEDKITKGRLLIIYYFLSAFSFLDENYSESMKWLSKILQHPSTDFSSDYQCYARIMNLIVHYELKNYDHLEYAMKSTYYFLRKRKKIYKYEDIIIRYMKKSLKAFTAKDITNLFDEMKHDLEQIYRDDYEKNAFDALNILPWLITKSDKISMVEATKRINKP